jgi:hypothetical protein
MSALPGVIGLVIFLYVRPQEFFEPLKEVNFLYLFIALSLAGLANDISRKRTTLMWTPHLRYILPFNLWCIITLGLRKPGEVTSKLTNIAVCLILYCLMATSIQSVKSYTRLIVVVFSCGVFTAFVGAHQGLSPFQCVVYNPADKNSVAFADGRECLMVDDEGMPHDGTVDCMESGKPGMAYQCEKAGLFGTTSCGGGRVRYLGVLLDPNELSLATALAIPFAFAFLEMKRSVFRLALLIGTLVVVGLEIGFTQSRGGQVTMGAVLGAYFVKKYGWKRGALVGVALAVPILALGGRHDESAEESTLERLGCAAAGIKMLMSYPIRGVGYTQYTEFHFLTAHNAYVLAAGELGLPGCFLFGSLIFLGIKVPLSVLQYPMVEEHPDTPTLKALAMGMLAAMIGLSIGIFFLSWCYHYVLWVHYALCGALYCCTKRLYPAFDVKITTKQKRLIFVGYVCFLIFWTYYIKSKGAWD